MTQEVPPITLPNYTNAQLIGADFAAHFFSDTRAVEVKMLVLDEMWQAIQALCAENDWSLEDGLRTVLANGLAYLRRRSDEGSIEAKRDYLDLSAQYSVMKFRAFQFMQAAQTLDMKLNGTRSELELLRRANEDLRAKLQQYGT
jgi:hypothetical protein